jgi:membrane protein
MQVLVRRLLASNALVNLCQSFHVLKAAIREWNEDKVPRLGAALAYYSVFSIGPLLMITIAVAALVFGREAAQGEVVREIKGTVGEPVALALQQLLANASDPGGGIGAAVIGFVTLLFGASGVFVELHAALNTIWKVEPKPSLGIWGIIQDRFLSFTMVLATGLLVLVSLVVATALSSLSSSQSKSLQGATYIWQSIDLFVSTGVLTLLFAMIYRFLPDAKVAFQDVWIGALLAAVLFTVGKSLLGWYLGRVSVTSAYGAAGSLVVILLWVYYSSQIFLSGAEFTRVYSEQLGSDVRPTANSKPASEEAPARQGMDQSQDSQAVASRSRR